jgi:hypothetical protein
MSKRRVTPHKPAREGNTRELADLRRENDRLKRQVARLRKQIDHEVKEEDREPESKPEPRPCCPKCESTDLGEVTTPSGKKVLSCRGCKKWRSRPL